MKPLISSNHPDQAVRPGSQEADEIVVSAARPTAPGHERTGIWLLCAAAGLCALAAAAAAVSYTAQYRLVYSARGLPVVAGLEAAIPDAAALVFACLGVALALHGRRAVRARVLNVAAAGASVFMNVIAAAPGWRDLAVWAMPPTAYALASDTLIGVVRAQVIARHQELDTALAAEQVTLLAAAGGLILWLLRLSIAPVSTLAGFRAWVREECPVAPGRRAPCPAPAITSGIQSKVVALPRSRGGPRGTTKTALFLALVIDRHGPLGAIPLGAVGKISSVLAPQIGLNAGAARAALRRAVLANQDGGPR